MAQPFDLKQLADRLGAVAERVAQSPHGVRVETSTTDVILAVHGPDAAHGQGRTESLPFGVLFHDPEDRLGQALDRLERYCEENKTALAA